MRSLLAAALIGAASAARVTIFPTAALFSETALEDHVHSHLFAERTPEWASHYDFALTRTSEINGHKFHQFIQKTTDGIELPDSVVTAHETPNGELRSVVGFATDNVVSTNYALTQQHALEAFDASYPHMRVVTEPTLLIKEGTLVWEAVCNFIDNEELKIGRLAVSATDGHVVGFESIVYNGIDRNVHLYPDECTFFWVNNVPGDLIAGEGDETDVPKAQMAYDNMGWVYRFYEHFFDRASYDGKDSSLVASIEMLYTDKLFAKECFGDNAAWVSDPYNQMIFFVDGSVFKDIEGDLSVMSHEISHAVTDTSSGLVYKDESGALNEAFSDCLGAGAKAWVANGGTHDGNPKSEKWVTEETTYWIGDNCLTDEFPRDALRYMNNPTLDGSSPDNYDEIKRGNEDNGYVHSNSGIFNLFFYLLSEGGYHPRVESNFVNGIGIEKALQIVYHANTALFNARTDYEQARTMCASAAEALYGIGSQEAASVHEAMDAVRVPGSPNAAAPKVSNTVLRGAAPVL